MLSAPSLLCRPVTFCASRLCLIFLPCGTFKYIGHSRHLFVSVNKTDLHIIVDPVGPWSVRDPQGEDIMRGYHILYV